MAFIKLIPPQDTGPLPVAEVIRRLEDEFEYVDVDPDGGQDHVASMIAAILGISNTIPGKQEQIARLQSLQDEAVYISFGDDLAVDAQCCVMPDSDLFFGNPDEIDGPARPLVERAATALGYAISPG